MLRGKSGFSQRPGGEGGIAEERAPPLPLEECFQAAVIAFGDEPRECLPGLEMGKDEGAREPRWP